MISTRPERALLILTYLFDVPNETITYNEQILAEDVSTLR